MMLALCVFHDAGMVTPGLKGVKRRSLATHALKMVFAHHDGSAGRISLICRRLLGARWVQLALGPRPWLWAPRSV